MTSIFMVDDDIDVLNTIREYLYRSDYEIIWEATNGKSAIEGYKRLKPDIFIMDFLMPKRTGFSIINEIMQFDPNAKIIGISALDAPTVKEGALDLGVKYFFQKPIDLNKLIEAIKKIESSKWAKFNGG